MIIYLPGYMVKRKKPTASVLSRFYNAVYESIKTDAAYYTSQEVERLKEDENNVFLEKGVGHGVKRKVIGDTDGA